MTVASVAASKKAIIFDLFHTLTSLESGLPGGLPSTSELLGVDRVAWNDQLLKQSRDRLVGHKTDSFQIIADMARAIDPSLSDERIQIAVDNREARFRTAILDMPDETVAVLQELRARGKSLGLISNADVMEVSAWGESKIQHLFDSTVFSCAVGWVKPEREIYELALKELGVHASDALFVGDGGSDELKGAKEAGITAVMVAGIIQKLWPGRVAERACQADYVIERLGELLGG
jgi:putative hydrolase of the HAD superfamily